jgi:hypothetical protein
LKKTKICAVAAILLLSFVIMFQTPSVNAAGTVVSVVNAENGTNEIILPGDTPINSTFLFNITVTNVTGLAGWQINVTWNPALLRINSSDDVYLPTDNIFAGLNPFETGTIIDDTLGNVLYGAARGIGKPDFTGSGVMCHIRFATVKNGTGEPISCDIILDTVGAIPTELVDKLGVDIPFTSVNTHYVIPEFHMSILLVIFLITTLCAFAFGRKTWHGKRLHHTTTT